MSVSVSTDGSDVTLNFSDLPDQRITTNEVIRLGPGASMVGDFDSNGSVDFLDFFMFADAFGSDGRAKLFALAEELIGLPRAVSLAQNYPLRSASGVLLEVYDLGGQRVRKLVDHYHDGGRYQVS